MADPFSIAAGIGGLIQLADVVFHKTLPFLKEVKNQRSEISKLSSEVASLAGTLHSLRLLSEGGTVPIKHEDVLDCQQILEELRDRLKKAEAASSSTRDQVKKIAQQLRFPYERQDMQKTLERLERLKSTFGVALAAESIASQIELKADIKAVKDELFRRKELETRIMVDETRKKVLNFFNKASPKENHAMSLKLRHEGTGLWLLKEPRFAEWLRNYDSHIWLYGIPGAGKTVLASLVIEQVLQHCNPSEAIAYFYCDYKDAAKQDPCNILASLASQIAVQHEKAYHILEQEHKTVRPGTNNVEHLKPDVLSRLLSSQLALFDYTTIIIDGLDECGDSTANVLDHLVLLAQEHKLSLRLAILSRDEHIIRQRLTEMDCQSISIAATSTDIRLYAASEIEQRVRSARLLVENASTKERILQGLIDKAQGMFRWVACQLDYICDLTSDEEYCEALDSAPPTLFESYERQLVRLKTRPKSAQDLVAFSLMWILFAEERLDIKELCEAVSIRTGGENKPRAATLNQIRKLCSSLIREAADGNYLEAAHFTVKEFFNKITKESYPHIAQFCISKEHAYSEFSKACLTYLNFKNFCRPLSSDDLHSDEIEIHHPFYMHAASHWILYSAGCWNNASTFELAKQLFTPPMTTNFKLWRKVFTANCSDATEAIDTQGDSLLHWAAYFSIHELLEWLIACGQDINLVGALGTPLSATMSNNHLKDALIGEYVDFSPFSYYMICDMRLNLEHQQAKACINTLIKNGARTDNVCKYIIREKEYTLSLPEAFLFSGDAQILEMASPPIGFFDQNVATRTNLMINELGYKEDEERMSELRGAVTHTLRKMKNSYIASEFRSRFDSYVMEIESEIVPDWNAMEKVWAAAKNDQADLLKSLLETEVGIVVNEKEYCERSDAPLYDSATDGDDEHGFYGKNALQYAAIAGSFACIQVLMDAGSNVHVTTDGGTVLHLAAASSKIGAMQCIEMLMNLGLSLYAENDKGWTALHFAAFSGNPRVVDFLLEKGFDPNLGDDLGRTAYHLAARNSLGDVMRLLLTHEKGGISGLHVLELDGFFNPPQLAVLQDNLSCVKEILTHIAIEELTDEDEPYLFFAARNGSRRMLQTLLALEPDISVRDGDQCTILHALAENYRDLSMVIMDIIKKKVVRVDARLDDSTSLHLLLSGNQPMPRDLLVMMLGEKPNDSDGDGNNYLMCLLNSSRQTPQKQEIGLNLIQLGVNPFQRNNNGKLFFEQLVIAHPETALHLARYIDNIKEMDRVYRKFCGFRTIHHAIVKGDLALFAALVQKGVAPLKHTSATIVNKAARKLSGIRLNCMHVAVLYDRREILNHICEVSDLLIDSEARNGCTALHLAAFMGSEDCVKLLLSKGANTRIQDGSGKNALHYAIESKSVSVFKILLEAGTPIVSNQDGESLMQMATNEQLDEIVEVLRTSQTSDDDRSIDLGSTDGKEEMVSSGVPFAFGSENSQYSFGFSSPITLDLPIRIDGNPKNEVNLRTRKCCRCCRCIKGKHGRK